MRRLSRFAVGITLLIAFAPRARAEPDWAAVEAEATDLLSRYVQIDTTNPPGNETAAANFLADIFSRSGLEPQVLQGDSGRGSVMARLPGTGERRPIVLLNHLDVVPATAEGWQVPPFSGAVRDGYVYGRGALDCKGVGVAEAMALLVLQRSHARLRRDVVFLGTAGEETGGQVGAGWVAEHAFDQLGNPEYVLNEGGHIRVLPNGDRVYEVAVSEKTPCWLRLSTRGPAGHGSAPPSQTAVTRLVRALDRLQHYEPVVHVTPEVQAYYGALAALEAGPRKHAYADLRAAVRDAKFRRRFLSNPHDAALVRDTLTPTVINAGQKTNVIPPSASAELDCRLLPGADPHAFVRQVQQVIGDLTVQVEVLLNFPPSASSTATPLYAAIRGQAQQSELPVVPSVLTGFTDSHYFREKGVTSYGFVPFELPESEAEREHGINERLSTDNLRRGVMRLVQLLQSLDQPGAGE